MWLQIVLKMSANSVIHLENEDKWRICAWKTKAETC